MSELGKKIINLADQMVMGGASMGGMGYDQLINSREELKELLKNI